MFFRILCCICFSSTFCFAQDLGIGQWRIHVPYKNATSLADAGDEIFVSANVFFFSYHKASGSLTRFDKVTGLSDVGVRFVDFNPFNRILLVVYENGNIDLLENNNIINISDIERKQMIGEKLINSVFFLDSLAFLSSNFGIVALDMKKKEIRDTYRIGDEGDDLNVFAFTADDQFFYAATAQGVKTAARASANLANFSEWIWEAELPRDSAFHILNFQGNILANINDTLYKKSNGTWSIFYADENWKINNINTSNDKILISESHETQGYVGRINIGDLNNCCQSITHQALLRAPNEAFLSDDGAVWIADGLEGLLRLNGSEADTFFPEGPGSANVQSIDARNGTLWVAPGSVSSFLHYGYNREGVFSYRNGNWTIYNQWSNPVLTDTVLDLWKVAIHPTADKVYFGSWFGGVAEFQNNNFTIYNKNTSPLSGRTGDTPRTVIGGLAFDANENLWMTSETDRPLIVKKNDGTWRTFDPPGVNTLNEIIVDDYDQKWAIIYQSGIVVFNHGVDIDDISDGDSFRILRSGAGNGNLPNNEVFSIVNDLEGEIWIGTSQGIAVFYCPSAIFSEQGCDAQQIIVTQNGVGGYLLETERINALAVDGGNRKWVGTNNGVFVLSPDGIRQEAYYTIENSPLISNIITDIAIDHSTGEIFIGTARGLVSLRGEATGGGEEHSNVVVFPNPVRENYEGPIAIKGLAANANIKITDASGVLFYETTALGGQAVWDGKNYNGKRAKTGVYLIFSSNADGSSKHITKLLIIN